MAAINRTGKGCPHVLVTLVRHGETPENKSDTFQGQMDTYLSEDGIKQAELAGTKLRDENFSHVFSSDLSRARKTAEVIIKKSNFCSQIKIVEDSRLRERCYGEAEGCSKQQFLQMAANNSVKPSSFNPKGSETLEEVKKRVTECLNSIIYNTGSSYINSSSSQGQNDSCIRHEIKNGLLCLEDNEDHKQSFVANVLVVSHGGAIRQLVRYFADELASEFPVGSHRKMAFVSPNTGISKFEIFFNEQTKLPDFVRCIYLHNAEHLKEAQ